MCDTFHIMLNIGVIPIANKYCEGNMRRTLERGLEVSEIAVREAIETVFRVPVGISCTPSRSPLKRF